MQTEILEETIRYIDRLHDQLVTTIRTNGLPQLPTTTSAGKFKLFEFSRQNYFLEFFEFSLKYKNTFRIDFN